MTLNACISRMEPTSDGTRKPFISGQTASDGRFERVVPHRLSATEPLDIAMDCGRDLPTLTRPSFSRAGSMV